MRPLDAALEAVEKYFSASKREDKLVIRARVRAMLRAYDQVWGGASDNYEVLGVEKNWLAPLKSLLTQKDSGYFAGGKLDVILKEKVNRKRLLIMDHKFLAYEFDQDDIEHLLVAGQQNQYAYLGWANGAAFEGAIWDIIVKSLHVPRKESSRIVTAAKPERTLSRAWTDPATGIKHLKGTVMPAVVEVRETTPAETMDEFEERVYKLYCENWEKRYARPSVPVIKQNIADHIQELYHWTKELDVDSRSDVHLRNTEHCKMFNRPCEYLGICSGKSDKNDESVWIQRGTVHAELELPANVSPFKVITNSRMAMYKGCRLKHHYRYNLGLAKANEEEIDETLYVGTAGHIGLEFYWRAVAANQGRVI